MWKIEIVLCVAALFVSQTKAWAIEVEVLTDESNSTRAIDETVEKINNHSQELYLEILRQRLNYVQPKLPAIVEYERELEKHLQLVVSFVDHLISPRKHKHSNKTECRKFYNDYEREAVEVVLKDISNASSDAFDDISEEFGKLLVGVKLSLKHLKEQAIELLYDEDDYGTKSFNATADSEIENMRQSYFDNFLSDKDKFEMHYWAILDGSAVEEKVGILWENFLNRTPEVIEKTYLCVIGDALQS